MKISRKTWEKYIKATSKLTGTAAELMKKKIDSVGGLAGATADTMQSLINYAYGLATKYGEGAGTLAAEMYDSLAKAQGVIIPAAEVAPTATYAETAKMINGILVQSVNPDTMSQGVGRLVKQASVDTMAKNALRDGAEWAWVPSGDTCAFCIMLASRGWQRASKKALKNGHATHIHANCDCTYAVRFDGETEVEGYEPSDYYELYEGADGRTTEQKLNYMRRQAYAENKDEINAQKRDAYAKRKELNSSAAEEINVN